MTDLAAVYAVPGAEDAVANAVADGLGVHPSKVRILLGHTDIAPYGMGSRGATGGTAGGGTQIGRAHV